jgi:hypothetical protein
MAKSASYNVRRVDLGYLGISIKYAAKNAERNLNIIQNFVKVIPEVIKLLAQKSAQTAREIAPFRSRRDLQNSISAKANKGGFELQANPSRNPVKAFMQEYGYPYENYWGPYPPNPKRTYTITKDANGDDRRPKYDAGKYRGTLAAKIKGVGYLRAGIIVASNAIAEGKTTYSQISKSDVSNYNKIAQANIVKALKSMLLNYAKGRTSSSNIYTNKILMQLPELNETIGESRKSFGRFSQGDIIIPMRVRKLNFVELPQNPAEAIYGGKSPRDGRTFLI